MEKYLFFLIPSILLCILFRILLLPLRWGWKLLINTLCGYGCLLLLNTLGPFTHIYFPVNTVTVLIAGFLGLPGVSVLVLAQLLLGA